MEKWKVIKFCETASFQQLLEKERQLKELIAMGALDDTNATQLLTVVQETIMLRKLFGEDD